MNFGNTRERTIPNKNNQREKRSGFQSFKSNRVSEFRNILNRSRLTEEDLETFRQDILNTHRKKHFKVLVITAVLFVIIGILILFVIR